MYRPFGAPIRGPRRALRRLPDRDERCRTTGASSPTIGRSFSDFEDRQWIDRDGPTDELTPLGEFDESVVADEYPFVLNAGMRHDFSLDEKQENVAR